MQASGVSLATIGKVFGWTRKATANSLAGLRLIDASNTPTPLAVEQGLAQQVAPPDDAPKWLWNKIATVEAIGRAGSAPLYPHPGFRRAQIGVFLRHMAAALEHDPSSAEGHQGIIPGITALMSTVPREAPHHEPAVNEVVDLLLEVFPADFIEDVIGPLTSDVGPALALACQARLQGQTACAPARKTPTRF